MEKLDESGRSELHLAAYFEDYELVKKLVSDGFDIHLKDHYGWTPLVWAIDMASTSELGVAEKIIEYLVECGAKMDYEPRPGQSFLEFARNVDDSVAECVEKILNG